MWNCIGKYLGRIHRCHIGIMLALYPGFYWDFPENYEDLAHPTTAQQVLPSCCPVRQHTYCEHQNKNIQIGRLSCRHWDNGKENGDYYSALGLYGDNRKEKGNYCKLHFPAGQLTAACLSAFGYITFNTAVATFRL